MATHGGSSSAGKLRGWLARQDMGKLATLFPYPHRVSQEKCADHEIMIRVSRQILTKDLCPQSIAICNLQSAVSLHLTVSLYS